MRRPGVTRKLLWKEYIAEHPGGYGHSQFCDLFHSQPRTITRPAPKACNKTLPFMLQSTYYPLSPFCDQRRIPAMKKIHLSCLIVVLVCFLTASCLGNEAAGIPAGSQSDNSAGAVYQGTASQDGSLETAYHFLMSAEVDGLVADMAYDQLQSEWVADFTVDANGLLNGEGVVIFDALLFAVNDDLCGYNWAEKGQVEFVISGKVHDQGGAQVYPVKILLRDVERLSLEGPNVTCSNPQSFLKEMPDIYLETHRNALLSMVLTHLHQTVGNQIKLGQELEQTSGTVTYRIEVSLAPLPLD